MTAILKSLKYDNNTAQSLSNGDPGFVAMNDYGHLKVNVENSSLTNIDSNTNDISIDTTKISDSIYTSQTDEYKAETSKCQLLCAVRNDASTNVLCDTNNFVCPLACDSKGTQFVYVTGQSGSVSITNSDLSEIKTKINNIYDILNDVYNSTTHTLKVSII